MADIGQRPIHWDTVPRLTGRYAVGRVKTKCNFVYFQFKTMSARFERYKTVSGASGGIVNGLHDKILKAFTHHEHVLAGITGASSSSRPGITETSKETLPFFPKLFSYTGSMIDLQSVPETASSMYFSVRLTQFVLAQI